jgi:hypothetical protein
MFSDSKNGPEELYMGKEVSVSSTIIDEKKFVLD